MCALTRIGVEESCICILVAASTQRLGAFKHRSITRALMAGIEDDGDVLLCQWLPYSKCHCYRHAMAVKRGVEPSFWRDQMLMLWRTNFDSGEQ